MWEYKYLEDDSLASLLSRLSIREAIEPVDGITWNEHFNGWEPIFPVMHINLGKVSVYQIVLRRRYTT